MPNLGRWAGVCAEFGASGGGLCRIWGFRARFAEVPEVVHPIMFLLSDRASIINGAMLPVDGGFLVT